MNSEAVLLMLPLCDSSWVYGILICLFQKHKSLNYLMCQLVLIVLTVYKLQLELHFRETTNLKPRGGQLVAPTVRLPLGLWYSNIYISIAHHLSCLHVIIHLLRNYSLEVADLFQSSRNPKL